MATIGLICGKTGGDLVYYNLFDAAKHGEKLYYSLFRILTRTTTYDISIKARSSVGVSVVEYLGSGFLSYKMADFKIAAVDSDKTFTVIMRNDGKLEENANVYLQFAMLYTDGFSGERKIRVLNYAWKVTRTLYTYIKSSDADISA